jgi:hypothetical protein
MSYITSAWLKGTGASSNNALSPSLASTASGSLPTWTKEDRVLKSDLHRCKCNSALCVVVAFVDCCAKAACAVRALTKVGTRPDCVRHKYIGTGREFKAHGTPLDLIMSHSGCRHCWLRIVTAPGPTLTTIAVVQRLVNLHGYDRVYVST